MRSSNIGGQAVIEGVMMRHKQNIAVAVRKPDGEIAVGKSRFKSITKKHKILGIPIVRGFVAFIESLITGLKTLSFSASFYEDDIEKEKGITDRTIDETFKSKGEAAVMGITIVISLAIAIALFVFVPYLLSSLIVKYSNITSTTLLALIEGVVKVLIFLGYLFAISRMKDIKRTFMYHGAEHKCINCIETGNDLIVENVMAASKEHRRCGTSFIFIVLFISIIFFIFIRVDQFWIRFLIRILLIPVISGVSYEVIQWTGKSGSRVAYLISRPGMWFQRITTKEPTADMAEVAIKSVEAVFDWKAYLAEEFGRKYEDPMTLEEAFLKGKEILDAAGIDNASTDTFLLFSKVTGLTRADYILNKENAITDEQFKEFLELIERRAKREPCQYILKSTEFMGLEFSVDENVLIPRQDTEILAEEAINIIKETEAKKVLDLCTGSGTLAVAIKHFVGEVEVVASDVSEAALKIAAENAEANNAEVEFVLSDMFENIAEDRFDVIVSNPPYIADDAYEELMPEVKMFEPAHALKAGAYGLDHYKTIARDAHTHLNSGGRLLLEIGYDQADLVRMLLNDNYEDIEVVKDLAGCDRVIKAKVRDIK